MPDNFFLPALFDSLVQHSVDIILVLTPWGKIEYSNPAVAPVLNTTPQLLAETNILEHLHPYDQPVLAAALEHILEQKSTILPAMRFRHQSGEWKWLECALTNQVTNTAVGGIILQARDITGRQQPAAENTGREAYYRSLFQNQPGAVFALSPEGVVEHVNIGITNATGYGEQELQGNHFVRFLHPDFHRYALAAFKKALQGEPGKVAGKVFNPSGIEREVSFTLSPVFLGNEIIGVQGMAKDITKLKKAKQVIRQQAEQFNSIIESVTKSLFVLDKEWRYSYVNRFYAAYLGLQRNDLIGQYIWDVLPAAAHPYLYRKCQEAVDTGQALYFEELNPQQNQTLSYSLYPHRHGLTIYFSDVSKIRETERELNKLSFVASKITNGVVIMDAAQRIEWVNDGFTRLTGYSREEVVGRVPSLVLQGPETNPEASARITRKYNEATPFSEEVLNYRKTGEKIWFSIDVTPIFDAAGNLTNYIAIETDITEEKKKEEELVNLAEELMKQNRDLQQFTYIISHNMRAPVANVLGLIGLLGKLEKSSVQYEQVVSKLGTSAQHLDMVIKDLNKILTIRSNAPAGADEVVPLAKVINEAANGLQERMEECGATLLNDIHPDCSLTASKAYLYSIFHNLLSNAVKYRSPERPLQVRVHIETDAYKHTLLFEDNGIGIDTEKAGDQLFRLYKRFHYHVEGRGIGLYMVKTQVEALGGEISVTSRPGVGTTFRIAMPRKTQ